MFLSALKIVVSICIAIIGLYLVGTSSIDSLQFTNGLILLLIAGTK